MIVKKVILDNINDILSKKENNKLLIGLIKGIIKLIRLNGKIINVTNGTNNTLIKGGFMSSF